MLTQAPRAVDLLITAALLAFGFLGTAPAGTDQPSAVEPDALAYALVAAAALPLVWWRRWPVQVFAVTGAATVVYLALGYPFGPILFSGAFAAGALAARRPLRTALVAAAVDLVAAGAAILFWLVEVRPGAGVGTTELAILVAWAVAWLMLPGAIGVAVRIRAEAVARVRAEQARRAVSEERLAMAQEVHDVVGHGLAVIAMQAGVGLHVLDRNPVRAREALEAIRATSKDALEGLRAELETMRGQGAGAAPRRAGAGLSEVAVLVDRVRSGGIDVQLDVDVATDDVPAEVDLAAYRIVQESLTNVLRHAGASATAHVRILLVRGQLCLDVRDTGVGPPPGALNEGSGIAGMRERAARLGGSLDTAARAGGGFEVRARLPLVGTPSRSSA